MLSAVFNPIAITETNNKYIGVDLDHITDKANTSYFRESLSFLLECRKEFNESNRIFYKSIVESANDTEVIHESFGEFFAKIKEIIDKIIKYVNSLFSRFIMGLNSLIKNDKYLRNHLYILDKYDTTKHEIKFSGYKFTLCPEIPNINVLASFHGDFVFDGVAQSGNAVDFKQSMHSLSNQLNNDWYDYFRGEVLNKKEYPIYKSDYSKELFSEYRDGKTNPEELYTDSNMVIEMKNRIEAYDKAVSFARNTKDRIETEYNGIKKNIESMIKTNTYNGNTYSMTLPGDTQISLAKDEINNANLFIKAKASQIQEMSTIHTMAFAAKLDALNDCFKQDKTVLYKVMSKIESKEE